MAEHLRKAKKYENFVREFFEKWGNSLKIVNEKGNLVWVANQHKLVGKSGEEWAFDAAFVVSDIIGKEFKFIIETKYYNTSQLQKGEVAEVVGKVEDVKVDGVIIISSNDLSKGAERLAKYHGYECWKMPFNQDSGYIVFKSNIIETFDEEFYDTQNRVDDSEVQSTIYYSDGRIEKLPY